MKLLTLFLLLLSQIILIKGTEVAKVEKINYAKIYEQGPEALLPYLQDSSHRELVLKYRLDSSRLTRSDQDYTAYDVDIIHDSFLTDALKRNDAEMAIVLIKYGANIMEKASVISQESIRGSSETRTSKISMKSAFDIASENCNNGDFNLVFNAFFDSDFRDYIEFDQQWVQARLDSCCYTMVETFKVKGRIDTAKIVVPNKYYNVSEVYNRCGRGRARFLVMRGYSTFSKDSNLIQALANEESWDDIITLVKKGLVTSKAVYSELDDFDKTQALNVDMHNDGGEPALILALQKNHTETVLSLLSAGADPNVIDSTGNTPLLYAIHNKSMDQIIGLLKSGGDANVLASDGNTLLQHAFVSDRKVFDELVTANHSSILFNLQNSHMQSVLYHAVAANDALLVHQLIVYGASLDSIDFYGNCPLMHACLNSDDHVIQIILRQMLLKFDKDKMKEILNLHNQDGLGALHLILANLSAKNTSKLAIIANGANVNDSDNSLGSTPLMVACASGSIEDAEHLLSVGAELEAVNKIGQNALFYAVAENRLPMIKFLIEKGLSINSVDSNGDSPIHDAINRQNIRLALEILQISKLTLKNHGIYAKALNMARTHSFDDAGERDALIFALENFIGRLRHITNPKLPANWNMNPFSRKVKT